MRLWIARDEVRYPEHKPPYELYDKSPEIDESYETVYWDGKWQLMDFCQGDFERLCSLRLAPGECVEVEFTDPFKRMESKATVQA